MNLDDSTATLHLLRSTMMFELCHGEIVVASQKGKLNTCVYWTSYCLLVTGKAGMSIVGKHNTSLLLTTTIEYLFTELLMLK